MKVLFNAFSACRLRTGVGCYAKNLFQELRRLADDEVQSFPTGWLAAATRMTGSILARQSGLAPAVSHESPRSIAKLRQKLGGLVRTGGRKLSERGLRRASRRDKYDLYHEPNFIPWRCDLPAVATVHDLSAILHPEWHPPERARFHQRHFEKGLENCAHIIADSDCIRRELIRHFRIAPQRVDAIHLGVSDEFRPMNYVEVAPVLARLNLPISYLLYVGTIEPRKNLLTLLRAYCDLPNSVRASSPLVLAGNWGWNFEEVRDYYESTAQGRGVVHVGYVADADLPALYNGARALVYPSFYEGFGLPPIEMMACGGPVLASIAATLREVCGRQAHFLDPEDVAAWRNALRRIIEDDDWHAELSAGVVEHSRRFSWQNCAEQTLNLYRRVVNREPISLPAAA